MGRRRVLNRTQDRSHDDTQRRGKGGKPKHGWKQKHVPAQEKKRESEAASTSRRVEQLVAAVKKLMELDPIKRAAIVQRLSRVQAALVGAVKEYREGISIAVLAVEQRVPRAFVRAEMDKLSTLLENPERIGVSTALEQLKLRDIAAIAAEKFRSKGDNEAAIDLNELETRLISRWLAQEPLLSFRTFCRINGVHGEERKTLHNARLTLKDKLTDYLDGHS